MAELWAGIDAGKTHHHCVVIDAAGDRKMSRQFGNDEGEILALISDVVALAHGSEIVWATDLNRGPAGLLIDCLADNDQVVLYISGRTVHHAAQAYRGDGKTDAKDAAIIADQARMRRDLQRIDRTDETATELRLLTAHREDLVCDRTRAVNRLRSTLLEYFPGLEAGFDFNRRKGALMLLTKYQTASDIRRAGVTRIANYLRKNNAYHADEIATAAVTIATRQQATVAGEATAALIVADLARAVLRLIREVEALDKRIQERVETHADSQILLSIPGFGPLMTAEFIAAIDGDVTNFSSPDRLAGIAGVCPVPRDSGRLTGNHHRPKRYNRTLLRVCYLTAQSAARTCPQSRAYYDRKRQEGKNHKQAVLALARRRINVIWALLRDRTTFVSSATELPTAA